MSCDQNGNPTLAAVAVKNGWNYKVCHSTVVSPEKTIG
jgi:hypothetical protein